MRAADRLYGQRAILNTWAGSSVDSPIAAFLQHGWSAEPSAGLGGFGASKRWLFANRLVWSERQRVATELLGIPNVHAIGSPFLYLLLLLRPHIDLNHARPLGEAPRSATLAYPPHSTAEWYLDFDHVRLSSRLVDEWGRCTVCLHPVDVARSSVTRAYADDGHTIISHGSSAWDQLFLVRQLLELVEHSRVVVYGLGTATLYASLLGRDVVMLPHGWEFKWSRGHSRLRDKEPDFTRNAYRELEQSAQLDLNGFARRELGLTSLRSPDTLRTLLGHDSTTKTALARLASAAGRSRRWLAQHR